MRLVDTLDEQRVLEDLLEASKPPLPADAREAALPAGDAVPLPRAAASRARAFAASAIRASGTAPMSSRRRSPRSRTGACAFSPIRRRRRICLPVPHTAFRASVAGNAIVLPQPPFDRAAQAVGRSGQLRSDAGARAVRARSGHRADSLSIGARSRASRCARRADARRRFANPRRSSSTPG